MARQLAVFAADNALLIDAARASLARYDATSDPAEAQDAYAQFDDCVEDIEDFLDDMCRTFASTVDPPRVGEYAHEFTRQARKRFRGLVRPGWAAGPFA